jgi:hypothetical protein
MVDRLSLNYSSFYFLSGVLPLVLFFSAIGYNPATVILHITQRKKQTFFASLPQRLKRLMGIDCSTCKEAPDELKDLTISDIRTGDELSLAFREIERIPPRFAKSQGASTIKKLDLTECGIKYVLLLSAHPLSSSRDKIRHSCKFS